MPQRWSTLPPEPSFLDALDQTDAVIPRSDAIAPTGNTRPPRHKWSSAFADQCARMIARAFRESGKFGKLNVLPDEGSNAEPPTFIAAEKKKRVDVVVASQVSGLQIGVSLKGMNFRDDTGGHFDKKLTGRTYELQDEMRLIHEYQPAAFMCAVYFLPLAACVDKGEGSSFSHTVEHLRARTGRLDNTLPGHYSKADLSFVALYSAGDEEPAHPNATPAMRGALRFFDVSEAPPRKGRPKLDSTLSIAELVDRVAESYRTIETMTWAEPESER